MLRNNMNSKIFKNTLNVNTKTMKNDHKPMKIPKNDLNKRKKYERTNTFYFYILLAALRIVLTCMPQTGYIHPDEYFQSIEIIAGKVFNVEIKQPWEFNNTQPVRSIIVPYLTVGIPYQLLKILNTNLLHYFEISINHPYFLLIFPRLFVCLLSFVVDFCLYKICKINNEPFVQKLLLLGSSYVMFIYGTRTFSNTIEMILMALLLYLVADSQAYSRNIIAQNEYLSDRYKKSRAAVERARFYKLRMLLPSHSLRHCIAISVLTVTGVFNRPTFIAFALAPLFFWFHRGLGCKSVHFTEFHCRMFVFLFFGLVTIFTYILIDSFYFGHISMAEILLMDISMKNFVVTPLNFIKYNIDVKKLAEHGLHPRSLHILVNMPLLYNVLGIVTIGGMSTMLYRFLKGRYTSLPHIYSIQGLMTASIIAPVAALSYFPHQEPRFLIPVTLPVVLLYSDYVIRKPRLYKLWIFINLLCLVFYGFVHQAGLYPATVHLSKEVRLNQIMMKQTHLVTSHIYSLPLSFFQQPSTQTLYYDGASKYKKSKTLFIQEMGSLPLQTVVKHLSVILTVTHQNHEQKSNLFLFLPTSKQYEIETLISQSNITLTNVKNFYPHISTEALPEVFNSVMRFYTDYSIFNFIYNMFYSSGLGLYQIHKNVSLT